MQKSALCNACRYLIHHVTHWLTIQNQNPSLADRLRKGPESSSFGSAGPPLQKQRCEDIIFWLEISTNLNKNVLLQVFLFLNHVTNVFILRGYRCRIKIWTQKTCGRRDVRKVASHWQQKLADDPEFLCFLNLVFEWIFFTDQGYQSRSNSFRIPAPIPYHWLVS